MMPVAGTVAVPERAMTHGQAYSSSPPASLDPGVRLERRPAPAWLKVLLLLVHLVPLVLIAVCSGLFAGLEENIKQGENLGLVVARSVVVLVLLVSVAELVENAVLVPLCARGAKLPSLLLSWRGVALGSADQRMFRSWTRTKFTALQCVLLVSWAVFWNVVNPMGHGVGWGGRVYNGLVPNLLVCTLAVRARGTYLAPTSCPCVLWPYLPSRCAPSSASSGRAGPSRTSG